MIHRAAIGALVALVLAGCKNDLDRVAAIDVEKGGPDRITFNGEYHFSDSGRVTNLIRSGRIAQFGGEAPHTEFAEGVELLFFGTDGRTTSRLTAERGMILDRQQRMQVDGDVVFLNAKGERLETEQLIWAQDSDRVWTDRPVRVIRSGDIIHGNGLDAVEDFSRYTVRNITGILHLDPLKDTLVP